MRYVFFWMCLLLLQTSVAQQLRGRVLTAEGKPVPAASVYLNKTTVGTVTREDGRFLINPFPQGEFSLVVSCMGYETKKMAVNGSSLPDSLVLVLTEKVKNLQSVTLQAKRGWGQWGNIFVEHFIGQSHLADRCKLTNPEVLLFEHTKGWLKAKATAPLVLENTALGYHVTYELDEFTYSFKERSATVLGHARFVEMKASDTAEANAWKRNRQEVYEGSVMHFMRCLYRNRLKEEGFQVTSMEMVAQKIFDTTKLDSLPLPLQTGHSLAFANNTATVSLRFNGAMVATYPAKPMPAYYLLERPKAGPFYYRYTPAGLVVKKMDKEPFKPTDPITAEFYLAKEGQTVRVLYDGQYLPADGLVFYHYWTLSERLATLLPFDYGNPQPSNAQVAYKPQ